ncbi:MAG: phospholipid carrier-dependent glycosyltransferase [Chloroflexi bacterium]|nr:phospholipid carrier-dependent glycosyltransferase [Chloroflexota bacterium]
MASWLEPTIVMVPFAAWMFLGVGVPWALALLPRNLWADRTLVIGTGMALGPLGHTALMFGLGTAGRLRIEWTLAGSALLAAVGLGIAWQRREDLELTPTVYYAPLPKPLTQFELFLIAVITVVLLANVVVSAYWPFVAYDPLWVYGYNAKVFFLEEAIPDDIGYYPQMLPLGYTYMQQAWGAINDHAARVIVPWFNLGSVLMAYVLGRVVFESRRTGLLAATIWVLYPHVLAWGGAGDLELPLTMYFTGGAAFFIAAWRTGDIRHAVLAGLMLAGAVWTKPTGGALALGVLLVAAGYAALNRVDRPANRPAFGRKLRLAVIMALVAAPLGGMWYVRNLALGHDPLVFPAGYWHDQAQRSGQELGWPVLLASLVALLLVVYPPARIAERRLLRFGLPLLVVILLLAGTLPSAIPFDTITEGDNLWQWARGDLGAAHKLNVPEIFALLAGFGLLAWLGRDVWREWPDERRTTLLLVWGLLLPYALLWFWNYSYHYRLSFPIVPLLVVQLAALIDGALWTPLADRRWGPLLGGAVVTAGTALALVAGVEFTSKHWGDLQNDEDKYDAANPALMQVVHLLEERAADTNSTPVVVIPGEDRLPFFFPEWDIRNSRADLPTSVEDLGDADIFVDNSVYRRLAIQDGLWPNALVAEAEVGAAYASIRPLRTDGTFEAPVNQTATGPDGARWPTVLDPLPLDVTGALPADDGNFRYVVYRINRDARTTPMTPVAAQESEVLVGDFVVFLGHDLVTLQWQPGEKVALALYWQPTDTAPPALDYSVYIHLLDADGNLLAQWDGVPMQGQYPARFWRPGESLLDYWLLRLPEELPSGPAQLRIGLYDPASGERLPVTVDGEPTGADGITLHPRPAGDFWIEVQW